MFIYNTFDSIFGMENNCTKYLNFFGNFLTRISAKSFQAILLLIRFYQKIAKLFLAPVSING